ncbi:MAG: hypothetical protein UV61_C0005G0019 [Candidatus Gottesmanbacteria bacterium GW2011_GWB1_43_11]|uniref:Uncharacterized protein n=1 Tax=Candidatus Gottesmanbacteria bacterium GW2011_GWB1_43_11 TaxID=1618446 RepID=A0A0G1FJG0_9BACT|nr:MAG: hypothetical protein UV04_C0010G0019 [Candidatus Gottesmanbacteria bacterium GW2011_GWA2_42_16]KKS55910.1 MAG: hypothetical protein UV17_C0005G0019 [Candidatus Gottesmanbacteria bacterium GW2011_GWA1_42_26]KKS86998.1 MAG: hypothetical protein UV61_C0005G0019 [Candidatus Gottesmanbacteria bacterium GW2011_GWB1_43_11]OGG07810.1 MAG: hypothetical protein A2699_04555 [Candidatus Gottesmanbacteria bacterium RIFCSPHIGHO2_01_FULL_43_15]OGG28130.1 MAG: hypothetical protein A3A59_00690 [Candidat
MKNQKSILEIAVNALIFACMIGLIVGFTYTYFIPAINFTFALIDKNSMSYVYDQFEPFRIALLSGFMGSFLSVLLSELYERRNQK